MSGAKFKHLKLGSQNRAIGKFGTPKLHLSQTINSVIWKLHLGQNYV
jgi:hypothetical protein